MNRSILVLLGLFLLQTTTSLTWAEHRPDLRWMVGYRAADNGSCCGANDCIKAEASFLTEPIAETVQILVTNVQPWGESMRAVRQILTVPTRSVHRSEEAIGYWCHALLYANTGLTRKQCGPPTYEISEECMRCVFMPVGG